MSSNHKSPSTSGKSVRVSPIPGMSLIYYNGDRASNILLMKNDFSTSMVSKHGMIATCIETNEAHTEDDEVEMPVIERPSRPTRISALADEAGEELPPTLPLSKFTMTRWRTIMKIWLFTRSD